MPRDSEAAKDPNVGWYEYRGARFRVTRHGWTYVVSEITLPWLRGSMLALTRDTGWSALTFRAVTRRVKRAINAEIRERQRNGEPIDSEAYARKCRGMGFKPIPERERDYRVLA
ncbi:MAG TPA: hypothetical protein VMU39_01480 [Solirubrobacteraceae bacterium]|nr:hypothetical protein [Solirubrobacteraceae bacterium]